MEEEIYLMFLGFFRRLAMNVGHSIESSNPEQLSIYIMFEVNIILYYNETTF